VIVARPGEGTAGWQADGRPLLRGGG
jgi:hypothetical protein